MWGEEVVDKSTVLRLASTPPVNCHHEYNECIRDWLSSSCKRFGRILYRFGRIPGDFNLQLDSNHGGTSTDFASNRHYPTAGSYPIPLSVTTLFFCPDTTTLLYDDVNGAWFCGSTSMRMLSNLPVCLWLSLQRRVADKEATKQVTTLSEGFVCELARFLSDRERMKLKSHQNTALWLASSLIAINARR